MALQAHLIKIHPIEITAPIYEAMDRFRSFGNLRFLPVVHADGTLAGVLREKSLKGYLFAMYGYQLVRNHPLSSFISPSVTLPINSSVETALSLYSAEPNPDGLVIVDGELYAGVLLPDSLLSMYEENRVKIQSQLLQSQKMEAIGTLAGGIAHDFNNILMPVMGYTELIQELAAASGQTSIRHYTEQVLQATARARDLVQQILAFSRQQAHENVVFGLSAVIKEVSKLLRASLPSTLTLQTVIETERDTIKADPTQIHQVLMNLCTNAAYAMKDGGGLLAITLREHQGPFLGWPDVKEPAEEDHLCLTIQDSGGGIESSTLLRIFDPFFTTKPLGEGTGMGLAVVHGIVQSLRGHITVESHQGLGTCFRLYLPRAAQDLEAGAKSSKVEPASQGRGERILVVDDEPAITNMLGAFLKSHGYQPELQTNSLEVLRLFGEDPGRFDLIITDQTMPNLTGLELSRRLLHLRPALPIVLMTGFSDQLNAASAPALGIKSFLLKPVSFAKLGAVLRDLLDAEYSQESG